MDPEPTPTVDRIPPRIREWVERGSPRVTFTYRIRRRWGRRRDEAVVDAVLAFMDSHRYTVAEDATTDGHRRVVFVR